MSLEKLRLHMLKVLNHAAPAIMARGRQGAEGIQDLRLHEYRGSHLVEAVVMGSELYEVYLGENFTEDTCDCPYFRQNGETCKHMVAVALKVLPRLNQDAILASSEGKAKEATPSWEGLRALLAPQAKPKEPVEALRYTLEVPETGKDWSLVPWQGKKSTRFSKLRQTYRLELRPIDRAIMEMVPYSYRSRSKGAEQPRSLFAALELLQVARTLMHSGSGEPLRIFSAPSPPLLSLRPLPAGGAELYAFVRTPEGDHEITSDARLFGKEEVALWQGMEIFALDTRAWNPEQMVLLRQRVVVSATELPQAIELLLRAPAQAELPECFRPTPVQGIPIPVLSLLLQKESQDLEVHLRFRYAPAPGLHSYLDGAEELRAYDAEGRLFSVLRNREQEDTFAQALTPVFQDEECIMDLEEDSLEIARREIAPFLERLAPLESTPPWEVQGMEELRRFRTREAKVQLWASSGIDWFELKGDLDYGGQKVSLESLLGLSPGTESLELPDGSRGLVPRRIRQLLRIVQGLQEKGGQKELRISRLHQSLLQGLLEDGYIADSQKEKLRKDLVKKAFSPLPSKPVPRRLQASLRPYQEEGLHWLRQMRHWGTGGILADDMGLGKTVQVIACLCDFYAARSEVRPSLIVMPTSLIHNWQRELTRFAPHLKLLVHHGLGRDELTRETLPPRAVILTTYALLRNDLDFWRTVDLGYAVLDESQAIKNPTSLSLAAARALRAGHRLALTGTPVENHLLDLWSQFAFVNPALLGNREFFQREFAKADENDSAPSLSLLTRLIAPFYLRRTKEKVLSELPPLEERVLYVDMGSAQRQLYEKTKHEFRRKILAEIEKKGIRQAQIHIIEGMLRLRQIACDPRLYLKSSKAPSAKLDLLLEKLQEDLAEGHKALIFSQFTSLLDYCGQALRKAKIDFAYLDGATRKRAEVIDSFTRSEKQRVFLISLKAGGAGLNLACADYVFHLDPWWNPAVEAQATGRAHRIGQTRTVQSIKLIASDTIEEKILQLQDQKRQLAAQVISSDQGLVQSLNMELVQELFR